MTETQELDKLVSQLTPPRWSLTDDPSAESAIGFQALKKHSVVQQFISDFLGSKKKVYFVHAGRRSFKSELGKRLLVDYSIKNRNKILLYCGPTARQVSDIAWDDLKNMLPKIFIDRIQEADMIITLKNSTKIKLYSLDNPERIEGQKIDGIIVDEAADMPDNTWYQSILPAISDNKFSWAILISTPGGRAGDFYKVYEKIQSESEKYAHYGLYHWHRGELLGSEWLEEYKSQVDRRSFEQEWLGNFVSGQGLAYSFDPIKHLNPDTPFRNDLPIDIAADFNVNIMPWPISQSNSEMTFVLDEIVGRGCTVENMCRMVKDKVTAVVGNPYSAKNYPIRFYGDATAGYIRDPAAHKASWQIIRDCLEDWNIEFKVGRTNPRIGDRISITNARLLTADGKIHCQINPKAKELVLDLESISYEDITKGEKTRLGEERSHASDAFGYMIWRQYQTNNRLSTVRSISQ